MQGHFWDESKEQFEISLSLGKLQLDCFVISWDKLEAGYSSLKSQRCMQSEQNNKADPQKYDLPHGLASAVWAAVQGEKNKWQ